MSYVALWPYFSTREGQVWEGGRPGFLNAIGTPEEYDVLDKYGVTLQRSTKWTDFSVPTLKSYKKQLQNALKTAPAADKTVLNKYIFLIDQAIKAQGGGFFGGGFWDTLVQLSGVNQNTQTGGTGTGTGTGTAPTSVQCADGSMVANPTLCPAPKKKNNLPLYLGITAGVLVVGTIVTIVVIKNRNQK